MPTDPSSPIEQLREAANDLFTAGRLYGQKEVSAYDWEREISMHLDRISAIVVESIGEDEPGLHSTPRLQGYTEGQSDLRRQLRQQWSNQGEK